MQKEKVERAVLKTIQDTCSPKEMPWSTRWNLKYNGLDSDLKRETLTAQSDPVWALCCQNLHSGNERTFAVALLGNCHKRTVFSCVPRNPGKSAILCNVLVGLT